MQLKLVSFIILLMSAQFVVVAQTLNDGLHAHYKFDGDLTDASLYINHLSTLSGTVTYPSVSGSNLAAHFNGSTYVSSSNVFDNSSFTSSAVSVWMKTTTVTNDLQIIIQGAAVGFGVYIQPNSGKVIGFFDGSSVGAYESSASLTNGEWHHIVIQNNGTKTFMYIDGVLDGSINENLFTGNADFDNRLYFGKSNQNAYPLTADLNDARVYDRMLTICEIHELYGQGGMQPIAHFPFDNDILDITGNNNNLGGTGMTYIPFYASLTDKAVVFDGTNSISSVNPFNNSSFTKEAVSFWMKTSTITTELQTVVQGAAIGFGMYIAPNTGKLMVFFDGSSVGSYQSPNPITDGNWHHIIAQTNGTTTYLYIDGVLNGSINENLFTGNGGSDNRIFLGKSNQNIYPYTGAVSELMIFNRLLEPCEIKAASCPGFTLDINENKENTAQLSAFPNPSDGDFIIDLGTDNDEALVTVIDINGIVILSKKFSGKHLLDLHIDSASGIYFAQINTGNKNSFIKLIKR